MNRWVLSIILFCACGSEKNTDCSKYKNGQFALRMRNPGGMKVYLIKRQDSIQTEMDPITMKYTKGIVKWISDCKYELYYDVADPSAPGKMRTDTMTTEILGGNKEYYLFDSYSKGSKVMSDTMWVEQKE